MQLEMISTGEEVLAGQITDTNASWFSNEMMNLGIELQRRSTIGDRLDDLVSLFIERSLVADLILVNGGLGPTSDDLSAEAMAKAAGVELVEHSEWRAHLEDWFAKRGREMPASNLKQCLIPAGAVLVDNPSGSAPGFRMQLNRAWLFFTPGVPSEFKPMVMHQFIPFMQATFDAVVNVQLHKLVTIGHGESSLADRIRDLAVPPGITLGYRPSPPHVEIKVFARGDAAIRAMPAWLETLREKLGTAIVTERFPSIAEEVHQLMLASGATLALAESCSGGMLSSQLVEFPGSSNYLQHSIVSYSNDAKQEILGVPAATLENFGAVSRETALAMARGARRLLDSDYALSITGIAGPDGGTEAKPVGTVAIALTDRKYCWVRVVKLSQRSRTLVRVMSCAIAMDMLRRRLLDEEPLVHYPFIASVDSARESAN
jgi:nicotinamide-nucleotide amidase